MSLPARRLPAILLLLAAPILTAEAAPSAPPRDGMRPSSIERVLSMWAGVAGADGSDFAASAGGLSGAGRADDFGAFLLLGARIEIYPAASSSVGKHFGFAFDLHGFAGEADIGLQGGPSEEVYLTGGALTSYFLARFRGRAWEGYVGAGVSLLWASRLSDLDAAAADDTDLEAPLDPALIAGARLTYPGGWFLLFEVRHQRGENTFEFDAPPSRVEADLAWRMNQLVIGSGYRF